MRIISGLGLVMGERKQPLGRFSPAKSSIYNRGAIKRSETCGCFYCLLTFRPSEVQQWTDSGETALCPHCGIDSVIGSSQVDLTPRMLERCKASSFGALPPTPNQVSREKRRRQKRSRKRDRR